MLTTTPESDVIRPNEPPTKNDIFLFPKNFKVTQGVRFWVLAWSEGTLASSLMTLIYLRNSSPDTITLQELLGIIGNVHSLD